MLTLVLDGMRFALASDYTEAELDRYIPDALFRLKVEQVYLADGTSMLVNWRAVRTVQLLAEPQPGAAPSSGPSRSRDVAIGGQR